MIQPDIKAFARDKAKAEKEREAFSQKVQDMLEVNPNVKQNDTESQCQKILARLEKGHGITAYQAVYFFDCYRLAGRIYELRQRGHKIVSMPIVSATGKKCVSYHLDKAREMGK